MTTLYLIRHCEAEGNLYHRTHGIFDSDITPRGALQLECLRRRFRGMRFTAVYSSALRRARMTAGAIAKHRKAPVTVLPELNERSMGLWEDFSWHEIKEKYPAEFAAWRGDLYSYTIPGGESEDGACERFTRALRHIAAAHPGGTVAVVAHSMVIKMFQFRVTGIGYDEVGWGDNTSVNRLEVDSDGAFRFAYRNDAAHLSPGLATLEKQKWWESGDSLEYYSLRYTAPGPDWFAGDDPLAAELREQGCALPQGEWMLGAEGERNMGVLCLREGAADTGEIGFLYVAQDMRGYGYASQLIGEALYRLRGRGKKRLLLHPGRGPEWAALLAKNAFTPAGGESCATYEKLVQGGVWRAEPEFPD